MGEAKHTCDGVKKLSLQAAVFLTLWAQCVEHLLVLLQHNDVTRVCVFTQKTAGQRLVHMGPQLRFRDTCFHSSRKKKQLVCNQWPLVDPLISVWIHLTETRREELSSSTNDNEGSPLTGCWKSLSHKHTHTHSWMNGCHQFVECPPLTSCWGHRWGTVTQNRWL